jgi:hypothetical protein
MMFGSQNLSLWVTPVLVLLVSFATNTAGGGHQHQPPYTEEERRLEYSKRGHTWPLREYTPNTEGWRQLMDRRFSQIRALPTGDSQGKWDGFIETLNSALTVPNHTEFGWGLTHAAEDLTEDIRQAIYEGLPTARPEGHIDVIDAPEQPLFIDREDLTRRALHELQPILEAWAGIELIPSIAYGFRLYRYVGNVGSSLEDHTYNTLDSSYLRHNVPYPAPSSSLILLPTSLFLFIKYLSTYFICQE